MSKNELTKAEARDLITPVIDDEVSEQERKAFMNYIADHDDVRREYESIKRIKKLINTRCPHAKAPDSLRSYLKSIGERVSEPDVKSVPIYDVPCDESVSQHKPVSSPVRQTQPIRRTWFLSVAASLLIIAGAWVFLSYYGPSTDSPIYNVEEYAYEHFMRYNGQFVPPTISTASLLSAETRLAQDYDLAITIPALKNAQFKGVMYGEFVPNFKAPMFEYYLPSEGQYIYIFAFMLDKMKAFGQLVRDQEAIKKCDKPKDFYVRNINGKYVVSWKWNDVWYAAISNHNGNTLASLVKPLQSTTSQK